MINNALKTKLEDAGFQFRTFKIEHLEEISTVFSDLARQGILDKDFYRDNLTNFNFSCKNIMDNPKSVIVMASPQYKSFVEFRYEGKPYEAVIPPIYRYPEINNRITDTLNSVFTESGFSFTKPVLPLKLLAVKSGLGKYGRNNLCYVPGMGSFVMLNAYITDYEFEEDSWGDVQVLESCESCTACIESCPTGAIANDRFLIRAQKCITNFNEYDVPMPDWIKPDWHNSVIGCMKCQAACPHNSSFIDMVDERIFFNAEESKLVLNGCAFDNLPQEARNKLSNSGLEDYYHVLPRNMRLLMD